jgi:hypothetical protein
LWHDAWKLQSPHLLGGATLSTFPWQHGRRRCWRRIVGTCFHSNEYNWRSNALHTESRRFLGNAYRYSNSEERDNSTVISLRFDQNLPLGENWPTENRQKSEKVRSEVFLYVVSSLFVLTKCYSYSKTESVVINCSSARWISNKSLHLIRNPLITCRVTRIRDNMS